MSVEDFFTLLVSNYGYAGVFLVELISNATILFPLPGAAATVIAGALLDNKILVVLAAGLGAALGELTGYLVGYGGKRFVEKREEYEAVKRLFSKIGLIAIFLFSALPLPFDIVGMLSGATGLNPVVFFALTFMGKTVSRLMLVFLGASLEEMIAELFAGRIRLELLLIVAGYVALYLLVVEAWKRYYTRQGTASPEGGTGKTGGI
ncbi:MAG TPA: VTT domain-containing protein [Thermoproteota archaeon]|nr:VTT domain-containing protein [Thermoproteota archaeon]